MTDMADITITAGSVLAGTNASIRPAIAGATITAGQPVYLDATVSNQAKPARANADTTSRAVGIALNGASSGQPVDYVTKDDDFTIGGTTTAGIILTVSAGTAGGIAPSADMASGNFVTLLGVMKSATKAKIDVAEIQQSRVAKA
jgi:hypothetical protein